MLTVSVLGPVEVRRQGEAISIPAGKTSELLVRLALEAGTVVRADRLLEDLWAQDAVRTRRNTLQSKVTMLRRALGDPSSVVNSDGGYTLAVDPADVDALTVVRDTAVASRLLEGGDHRAAAELCASALDLYRGDVLLGAGEGEWAAPHRARLEEARIKLLETQLSARLQGHDIGDAIGELETAVAEHPYQESLWVLLITALYREGRQADALAAYQRVREKLADELGLEPGPQLRQVEQQILVHDAALVRQLASLDAGNLPAMTDDLVGRSAELEMLSELLATNRLVEVTGPGGVGKTALAIAAARAVTRPGGAWLARLESATTANEVTDTAVAALKVPGEAALFERLRHSNALVVLDNCEHVVDAAAALAARMLEAGPDIQVLCTSQLPLGIEGEEVLELGPLAHEDAVELFNRRAAAQRRRRGPQVDERVEERVHELCRSLDGLPLAIELAAARTRTLSIDDIARRLDDRFALLSDPTSRRPERRRALRATIAWSYELLFPDDQRGLWTLATFAGGARLSAVESVLDSLDVPAPTAIDVVGRLAARSLVIVEEEPAGEVRYRLLDSIRAFAVEMLAEAGLTDRALASHAQWFEAAAASSTDGVRSARQDEHLRFARAERANIDAALTWGAVHDPQLALSIVNGFGWAWVVLGDSRGAERILTALAGVGNAVDPSQRATALLLAAWIEASIGALELAREHIGLATEIADDTSDTDLQARCAYYLAYVVSHHGDFRQAIDLTDRSRALYLEIERPWDLAANELFAARAAISAGDQHLAAEACDRVETALTALDDPWLQVRGDAQLGELARLQGRFDDAVTHYARASETSRRLGFRQTEAYQVASLGRAQCQAGDYDAGAATLRLAIDKAEATGDVRMAALARTHLGRVLRALGENDLARAALESAVAWHRAAGGGEQALLSECLLAAMDAADGVAGAHDRLVNALDAARTNDDAHVEVFALDALARIQAEAGDAVGAMDLWAEADRRMDAASHFIAERDRVDRSGRGSLRDE